VEDAGDTPEEAAEKEKEREKVADDDKEKDGEEKKRETRCQGCQRRFERGTAGARHAMCCILIRHNAEPDAVDLLKELEIVDWIAELVDENMYA